MGLSTKGPITPWKGSWAEQQRTNSIRCAHGKGLACRTCYDQRFGLDWKPAPRKLP